MIILNLLKRKLTGLIKNFFIRDIQEQPAIIHESYYPDRERLDTIFGKYPNADKVKNFADIKPD